MYIVSYCIDQMHCNYKIYSFSIDLRYMKQSCIIQMHILVYDLTNNIITMQLNFEDIAKYGSIYGDGDKINSLVNIQVAIHLHTCSNEQDLY